MKSILFLFLFCFLSLASYCQIFLNVEFPNKAETIKYSVKQTLHFKHVDYPDQWRSEKIISINPEKSLIITENDILHLDQIDAIRMFNPWARYLANSLYTFSAQWIVIGGIAGIFFDYEFNWKDIAIPIASAGVGYLVHKLFYTKTYQIGNFCRLRIIDLRMSID